MDRETLREASQWFVLLHGADAADHQAAFDAWLAANGAHRTAYRQIKAAFDMGEAWRPAGSEQEPRRNSSRLRSKTAYGAMALLGVVIAATGMAVAYRQVEDHPQQGNLAVRGHELRTSIGKIQSLELGDHSRVTLDTQTVMREDFSPSRRDVWLDEGRARFDVAHEARPFVVHAANGTVTAHGTMFDVRVEHGKATVQLLRGAIDVDVAQGPGKRHRSLAPGDGVSFSASTGVAALMSPQRPQIIQASWPDALLDVDQVSVGDLAAEANRYSAVKITAATPAIAEVKVSGRFRMGDSEQLARHLATLLDLKITRPAGSGIVLEPLAENGNGGRHESR